MQITLNKIAFDVAPVDGALRSALLGDPAAAGAVRRDAWAWDGAQGRFLVPVTKDRGVPLAPGLSVFVPKPGAGLQRASGPTARMAERIVEAVGAKGGLGQVTQALARVTGIAQAKVPFDAFAALNARGPYVIAIETDYAVVQLAHAARNLAMYAFVPGVVTFSHRTEEAPSDGAPDDAPAPGSIRRGVVLAPASQAALAIRRLAAMRRMAEMQAELGGTRPADLAPGDPRREAVARLGAEWRVLAPKAKAA